MLSPIFLRQEQFSDSKQFEKFASPKLDSFPNIFLFISFSISLFYIRNVSPVAMLGCQNSPNPEIFYFLVRVSLSTKSENKFKLGIDYFWKTISSGHRHEKLQHFFLSTHIYAYFKLSQTSDLPEYLFHAHTLLEIIISPLLPSSTVSRGNSRRVTSRINLLQLDLTKIFLIMYLKRMNHFFIDYSLELYI